MRKYFIVANCIVATIAILTAIVKINEKTTEVAAATVKTETTIQEPEGLRTFVPKRTPLKEVIVEEPEVMVPILDSIPFDSELQTWIYKYSTDKGISPYIIYALIERESGYKYGAIADTPKEYSVGLMQLNTLWHQDRLDRLGITDLTDPRQNITAGIDYLLELLNYREDTTLEWALMAYNGGPRKADYNTANGILTDYAKYILRRSSELEEEGVLWKMNY